MDIIAFILADVCYLGSFIFFKKQRLNYGFFLLVAGFIFHTLSIIARGWLTGYPPFFSLYEILIFFSWSIVLLSWLTGFHKVNGTFVTMLVWLILGLVCFLTPGIRSSLPVELRTVLFPIHVAACLLGYGAFFISFICGIFYLAQNKIDYDFISYRAIVLGLSFFSFGIIIGSIWAKRAWGSYWSWDPKETAALITWIIYAFWLFTRLVFNWAGKVSAWITIAGFFATLFTWFGINFIFASLHSYK